MTPPTFDGDVYDPEAEDNRVSPQMPPPKRLDVTAPPAGSQVGKVSFEQAMQAPPRVDAPIPVQRLDARDQYASMKAPVPQKSSFGRQLAAGLLRLAPGINMTDIPDEVAHPGYTQESRQYAANLDQAKRAAAIEDQKYQRELTEEQRGIQRRNVVRQEERDRQMDADRDSQRKQAEADKMRSLGARNVGPNGFDLSPESAQDYTIEQGETGMYQVPTEAKRARDKAEALGKEVIDVPQELRATLGDKAPRDQIVKASKKPRLAFKDYVDENTGDVTQVGFDPETGKEVSRQVIKGVAKKRPPAASSVSVQLTPEAIDQAAQRYAQTGQMPTLGMGAAGAAARQAIMNRAGQIGGNIAENSREYRAQSGSLAQLQRMSDNIMAFERTANKNADLALTASKQVDRTGSPFINRVAQAVQTNAWGDKDLQAFKVAVQTFANEYAKVMTNNGASGAVTDTARKEADMLFSTTQNPKQFEAAIAQAKKDMENRRTGLHEQLAEIRGRQGSGGAGKQQGADPLGIR